MFVNGVVYILFQCVVTSLRTAFADSFMPSIEGVLTDTIDWNGKEWFLGLGVVVKNGKEWLSELGVGVVSISGVRAGGVFSCGDRTGELWLVFISWICF